MLTLKARILGVVLGTAALGLAVPSAGLAQSRDITVYTSPIPSLWEGDALKGPVVYKPANLTFPQNLGKFQRARVAGIDGSEDFWVNYTLPRATGQIAFTVFLFKPNAIMAEHTIPGSLRALTAATGGSGTFIWSDGRRILRSGERDLSFFKGTYKTGIGPRTVLDYLYFADLGTWRVKIRVTVPASSDPADETMIETAISALDWRAILAANGDCSGRACQPDQPFAFNHHFTEMALNSIMQSQKGKVTSGAAAKPYYKRKVKGFEWQVYPLDKQLFPLLSDGYGALSIGPQAYTLIWHKGGKKGLVRFFSGQPSTAMIDREIDRLTTRPELSAFVPIADAAFYAEE